MASPQPPAPSSSPPGKTMGPFGPSSRGRRPSPAAVRVPPPPPLLFPLEQHGSSLHLARGSHGIWTTMHQCGTRGELDLHRHVPALCRPAVTASGRQRVPGCVFKLLRLPSSCTQPPTSPSLPTHLKKVAI